MIDFLPAVDHEVVTVCVASTVGSRDGGPSATVLALSLVPALRAPSGQDHPLGTWFDLHGGSIEGSADEDCSLLTVRLPVLTARDGIERLLACLARPQLSEAALADTLRECGTRSTERSSRDAAHDRLMVSLSGRPVPPPRAGESTPADVLATLRRITRSAAVAVSGPADLRPLFEHGPLHREPEGEAPPPTPPPLGPSSVGGVRLLDRAPGTATPRLAAGGAAAGRNAALRSAFDVLRHLLGGDRHSMLRRALRLELDVHTLPGAHAHHLREHGYLCVELAAGSKDMAAVECVIRETLQRLRAESPDPVVFADALAAAAGDERREHTARAALRLLDGLPPVTPVAAPVEPAQVAEAAAQVLGTYAVATG